MHNILRLFALIWLFSYPAIAADNTVTLTPGSGVTMRTQDVGSGIQSPYNILGNTTGTTIYGTAGTSNAAVLSVQGIASGTALPVSLSGTVAVTQSGTWTVQPGNTANTTAWLVTGTGGTFPATQSGTWNITNISGTISLPTGASTAAKQPALGTAGTASADVITVQGITSMTPLLVNPGTVATWGILAQGSTTSGQTGSLAMGAVTTASPTYTTAQTSPLSLDTAGGLRVSIISGGGSGGTASTFGGIFPPNGTAIGVQDAGSVMVGLRVGTAGTAASTVLTVQGIASGTAVPVSGTLTVNAGTNLNTSALMLDATGQSILTAVNSPIPAGTALIGKVGIDQTTVGTTNAISLAQIGATTVATGNGVVSAGVQRVAIASDNTAFSVNAVQSGTWTVQPGNTQNTTPWMMVPSISTVTTGITRPADTNAYTANDAFANSTSAPTTGGFTFTSACRASGGSGIIKDAVVSASAGTSYQGEVWIFDQAVTAVNDNAAFTVSDSDILNLVGVVPFTTSDITAANSISYVTQLEIGYTCIGTANLRYLVKIMASATPASAEVLTVRLKVSN